MVYDSRGSIKISDVFHILFRKRCAIPSFLFAHVYELCVMVQHKLLLNFQKQERKGVHIFANISYFLSVWNGM